MLTLAAREHWSKMIMNRTSRLLVVAITVAAATITGLRAGSSGFTEDGVPGPKVPGTFALRVTKGTASGSYAVGTLVTVSADAAAAGTQFAGWTGDVEILANPRASTTTATVPFMAVNITATYSVVPAANASPSADPH